MHQLWGKQVWSSYCFWIVFCVAFFKTINCVTGDHGFQIQMYNGTLSDLSHHVLRYKRGYDNDNYYSDSSADSADEDLEEIQEYSRHGGHRNSHQSSHHGGRSRNRYNSRQGGNSHGNRHGGSHGNKRKTEKTRVTMPSGRKYYITKPNSSKWSCGTKSTTTKLVTLNPTGKMGKTEYDMVVQEMQAAVPPGTTMNYQIVKIEKVVNGCLWRRYLRRQSVIYSEAHMLNERMLFHGSKKVTEILEAGFDERYAVVSGAFGPGIYFSPRSSTSNIFTGARPGVEGKMLLCRVTVGKLYKAPSYPDRHSHAPPGYHSVGGGEAIGDLNNEVVVYRGEQAYGEYLITYKL